MSPSVRCAVAGDAGRLAELRFEFRASVARPVEERVAFEERCGSWMAARLEESSRWRCWVAEEGGRIVGHLWCQLIEKVPNPAAEREWHAYITNLYVPPAARGCGIGTELLAAALGWCRDRGDIHSVILWPTEESRSLYRRFGFRGSGGLMERVLSPSPEPSGTSGPRSG